MELDRSSSAVGSEVRGDVVDADGHIYLDWLRILAGAKIGAAERIFIIRYDMRARKEEISKPDR
jgi:hypothetical protein